MSGLFKRWYALIAVAALGAAATWLCFWPPHAHTRWPLRAGIGNNALSAVLSPEGRIDALAVEAVSTAARRIGLPLQWVDCPEGPDRALRSRKVDLWPLAMALPERKDQFHITEPWLASERVLVTGNEPPKRWAGVTVAYGIGPENQVLATVPGAKPRHFQGDVEAVGAICRGEATAAYVMKQSMGAFILRKPPGCETVEMVVNPIKEGPIKLGIAARFESTREADKLRVEIGRMATEGSLDPLFDKYSLGSVAETANIYELIEAKRRAELFRLSATGFAVGFAILLWQVRRIREARHAAEKATSAKSEFLANMSHEIRTPLNGVVAMTELLARSNLSPEQRVMARVVLSSSEALMAIVNDILDFSKLEAGGMRVEEIAFDLRAVVEDAVRLFAPRADEKELTFDCRIAAGIPPTIIGDPVRVRQVLINLISNAIKFTARGGVAVEVLAAGDQGIGPAALLRVTDTGIGIEAAVSAKLFQAFSQADSTTTRKFGGTGLGLAIALRLVTLMGGSIGMESVRGEGSTFWFVIPAKPSGPMETAELCQEVSDETAEATRLAQTARAAVRVLVVEDNPVNQMVATRALLTLGYVADVVAGGEAALEALDACQFDLILMDCQMPGMDGYAATAEIRLREGGRSRVPIVAMTANPIEGDRERCLAAGMDDYLAKPIRLDALGKTMERWLQRKETLVP